MQIFMTAEKGGVQGTGVCKPKKWSLNSPTLPLENLA